MADNSEEGQGPQRAVVPMMMMMMMMMGVKELSLLSSFKNAPDICNLCFIVNKENMRTR
jgi:hypothetical protein